MPTFTYKAKSAPGQTVEGEVFAENRQAAIAAVHRMGLTPMGVEEKAAQPQRSTGVLGSLRVSRRDVTVFTRQLATLSRSHVPILRALRTIREQTLNIKFRRVVEDMETTVRDGSMLSESMQKYPALFTPLYLGMIRAGESGGVLDATLSSLAEAREREEDMRRKVQGAMAYPLLVLVVGLLTVFVLLSFFMPRVIDLFSGYQFGPLPLPTRILMGATHFCETYWFYVVAVVLLLAAVINRLMTLEKGRGAVDALLLRLPVVRGFIQQSGIARFGRTLALLLDAGVSIDPALELSGNALGNTALKDEVQRVREGTVQRGHGLAEGLGRTVHFPAFVANMVGIGEEAGRLVEALNDVAEYYEKEVDQRTRMMTSLIEPLLILLVGAFVGFIVAAMLLPIFQMGTGL